MPDAPALFADTRRLVDEARDAETMAVAARERRDRAVRAEVDAGATPRQLTRGDHGIGLSEGSVYRILGTAPS